MKAVIDVPVDMKGKLIELESAQYKRENEAYERRAKLEQDITKEAEEETDPDNIEHFKRQCYLAIKNRANYQIHTKEANIAWENYKKREANVREHFSRHPEHETQFLPYFKQKLHERGEQDLYNMIETAYQEIRQELLNLNPHPNPHPNPHQTDDTDTDNTDTDNDDCIDGVCPVND
jgi:hypothetical protein